jgi:hypothetical protein
MRIVDQAQDLLGSVNQYGLLYHLNRGWQREQSYAIARSTPRETQEYCHSELQGLANSIRRLSQQLSALQHDGKTLCLEGHNDLEEASCDIMDRIEYLEKSLDQITMSLLPR